jgi:protein SMG7
VKRCQLSCHRCLIFLGDLARYKEVHGNGHDTRSIDFSVAAGYYLQAASLWPPSGNPHNQVLAISLELGSALG